MSEQLSVNEKAAERYIDEVEMLVDSFRYETCGECFGDLNAHIISRDPLGHAHAYCMLEPTVI